MTRMQRMTEALSHSKILIGLVLGLALTFCSMPAFAQQDQRGDVQGPLEQQPPQGQTAPNQPYPNQGDQNQAGPYQQAPPQTLTLPAGTIIRVRLDEWLSSDRNQPGDAFGAVLDEPIVVDGWVVARRGQAQTGNVALAKKAGHGNGTSQLGVQLGDLTLVDGQQLPLQTQMIRSSASTPAGQQAATVGTTTAVGAAIGAAANGGSGAAVGAGLGVAAGLIGVMITKGKPTVIAPETILTFRLQAPVTISTERSQFAFQPVTQGDYDSRPTHTRTLRGPGPGGPMVPLPYYGYPYPYGYFAAPLAIGIYGGFGRGFGGFRGGPWR